MPPQKHGLKVKVPVLLTQEQYDYLHKLAQSESASGERVGIGTVIRLMIERDRRSHRK